MFYDIISYYVISIYIPFYVFFSFVLSNELILDIIIKGNTYQGYYGIQNVFKDRHKIKHNNINKLI
ncbi:hypothetical protein C923_02075 [Plasmodium falciparum UGT5.1]|uniref:Uncharacterized protein n=4 Tax=Plasmodium falciparum TaxID=5833 RepID=A0A024W9Q8_PLAFA|nr:hypothetical protein PFTANZ_02058 [Plasmodium falciparum Tanzania (2000708)]ETW43554.1 hypothetical protein PFNF135_02091 [Plasmodium falciparum NF135/5.C10]EUR73284.1 hypothetical protein PFBG_01997 [Plasmodium falciparum 7G8]EWC77272.1 hypothetical protein C923_02075 [Plasmodium falciparum UGT5.1]